MKPNNTLLILAAVLVASCSQPANYEQPTASMAGGYTRQQPKQRQYLALPGQSAVQVGTEDADDAFDRQANAYAQEYTQDAVTPYGQPSTPAPYGDNVYDSGYGQQPVAQQAFVQQPTVQLPEAQQPFVQQPVMQQPDMQHPVAQQPLPTVPTGNTVPGTADYAVQITNGTTGRLFVEAQDAAGHIFPCGPMVAGQSVSSQPDPVGPLKGPITVVVRDPDKPGAPEIRRYNVEPPPVYSGKTVGITILPGGRYRADVDNEVYYNSPSPQSEPGKKE